VDLLEREDERRAVETAVGESAAVGRVVVVAGEAGIGKTALVGEVCAALPPARVLWGACDPLITPRPLGPLRDVARDAGGALLAALEPAGTREDVLAATLDALAAGAVLVIDDLHWADDATLDLVALLGRRLPRARGCLVLTCRTEGLDERPEVRRVLAALPREVVRRVEPGALSRGAVAVLARRAGRDAAELHAVTGGNPFFVTELLAAPGRGVPASVRDAVTARAAQLGEVARAVAELAAVVPGPAALPLVEATVGAAPAAVDECVRAGLLELHDGALAFRHDLARRAVEDALAPARRRELDLAVLAALEAAGGADPARLAHHARRAGDPGAIRRVAPAAARAAAAAGGHRQALEQWEAALAAFGPALDGAPAGSAGATPPAGAGDGFASAASADAAAAGRAEALEGVAIEAYMCGRNERAVEARRALLALHEAAGDQLRAGDDLRWLARDLWWRGDGAEAAAVGARAIAVLEAFPDSRELAMALSGQSQLAVTAGRHAEAIALGERAAALARRAGDTDTVAHALINVGTVLLQHVEHERGRALLEEAHALAAGIGADDHAARALVNLAFSTLAYHRDDPRTSADIDRALRFVRDRELDGYAQYVLGIRGALRLMRGDWGSAEADARSALELPLPRAVSACPALNTLGRLQTRRGEPEAGATLDAAWELAVASQELQRLGPTAASRAEHAWLEGDLEGTAAAVRETYQLAIEHGDAWMRGMLGFWLWRAGEEVEPHPEDPLPYRRSMAGDWRGAAEAWAAIGFPYDRAEALSSADDEEAQLEALTIFDAYGATRAGALLRRRLRAAGVRRIPRGPRPASRAGLAGLTPRETEVLDLLIEGATNAEIAQALVIAPKTVDHHVSAVLGKLGVGSRREAGAAAARLAAGR
jgi:DNA-binding CsgD family transcriptional regulator/tetratricopeptide (TPR) repeat protein